MKNDFCAAWPVTTKRIGIIFRTSLIKTSWTDYIRGRPPWGEPLTETQRHGEKFLLGTPTSSSASSLRSGFRSQVSAFSVVPHLGRIQSHRSRSGYRRGYQGALDLCAGVFQCRGVLLKCLNTHNSTPSVWGLFERRQLVLSEGRVFK